MKTIMLVSALALFAAAPMRADDDKRSYGSEEKMEKGTKRPDSWITTKVKSSLMYHTSVSGLGTNVDTRNGVVTLKGEAENEAQKELATEYASAIEGVKRVNNMMTVKGEKTGMLDDAAITARVKSALMSRGSTSAFQTGVDTKNGIVTLTGEADNEAEKELAERLARDISGVKEVRNNLTVR